MAFTSPNMALTVWNLLSDLFDHRALAANFSAVDAHDHTAGKGVQLASGAFADGSVTTNKLATGAVTAAKITGNTITAAQIANATITATQIANATITATQIANNTITATQLASGLLTTALSSTPPGSPTDGQLWNYPADAAGTVWQFRYNAGSGSSSKWECVGGAPLAVGPGLGASPGSATYASTGTLITVPRTGEYVISWSMTFALGGVSSGNLALMLNGSNLGTSSIPVGLTASGVSNNGSVGQSSIRLSLAATNALALGANATAGSVLALNSCLSITPIRVA